MFLNYSFLSLLKVVTDWLVVIYVVFHIVIMLSQSNMNCCSKSGKKSNLKNPSNIEHSKSFIKRQQQIVKKRNKNPNHQWLKMKEKWSPATDWGLRYLESEGHSHAGLWDVQANSSTAADESKTTVGKDGSKLQQMCLNQPKNHG